MYICSNCGPILRFFLLFCTILAISRNCVLFRVISELLVIIYLLHVSNSIFLSRILSLEGCHKPIWRNSVKYCWPIYYLLLWSNEKGVKSANDSFGTSGLKTLCAEISLLLLQQSCKRYTVEYCAVITLHANMVLVESMAILSNHHCRFLTIIARQWHN